MYYYAFTYPPENRPFGTEVWCVLPKTQASMEIVFRADPKKVRRSIYSPGTEFPVDTDLDKIAPIREIYPEKRVVYKFGDSHDIDKIEAIKNLRAATNLGLFEAKKFVEFMVERKVTLTLWLHD